MSESVAAHYGDAVDDFFVADHVELPWPNARGSMERECRVVSLRDMSRTSFLPSVCGKRMWAQKKSSGMQKPHPSLVQTAAGEMMGGGGGGRRLLTCRGGGGVALREVERVPTEAGTRGS